MTTAELAESFPAESVLRICRHYEFGVRLSRDGSIVFDDDIPLWLANAIKIHRDEMISLMAVNFLGEWR